jgi:hypothetical protein
MDATSTAARETPWVLSSLVVQSAPAASGPRHERTNLGASLHRWLTQSTSQQQEDTKQEKRERTTNLKHAA